MGAVGGTIWHGIKGARNSPRGDRFVGALSVIKARAPVTGGNFGVWGGMFSTFDCAVKGWRQKEDMWNAIISGFLTGGCLAARIFAAHHPRHVSAQDDLLFRRHGLDASVDLAEL
ncbi:Mitochondrial import inner membrane translocase subunit TIM17 [Grifola frondosa]|uniref:Mitochondrial import inner membrane translocase subunit TIM17 n=1 Tax=Grifola frondosa TaxID=5627 RepID=A0A1C7M2D9_GRIFR|nr:Mitochondrial import inner membrane translocase subunit TIM17 [Grifola frondosa]